MSGRAYYNDNDPSSAAWLRELIRAGEIPDGVVDERSILDVTPDDLHGFTQCHFFAGIGGWAEALRLADWPEDLPVWTGSPPCQPFSVAGKREGNNDARHLAPHFVDLVRACRPGMLFGEQVASAAVFGKAAKPSRSNAASAPEWAWLDDLCDRLEAARYAVGANDFPSAGVGAPHIRQRTFFGAVSQEWLADGDSRECDRIADGEGRNPNGTQAGWQQGDGQSAAGGEFRRLADSAGVGRVGRRAGETGAEPGAQQRSDGLRPASGLVHGQCAGLEGHCGNGDRGHEPGRLDADQIGSVGAAGSACGMADSGRIGLRGGGSGSIVGAPGGVQGEDGQRERVRSDIGSSSAAAGGLADLHRDGRAAGREIRSVRGEHDAEHGGAAGGMGFDRRPGPTNGFWSSADWLHCRDAKWRPVEPGTFPLATGIQGRVGLLRGYGNAINPHAAAQFICAFREATRSPHPASMARHAVSFEDILG